MACLAYVDLNPILAKLCDRPERAHFTAGWRRIRQRQRQRTIDRLRTRDPDRGAHVIAELPPAEAAWLTPLERCTVGEVRGQPALELTST